MGLPFKRLFFWGPRLEKPLGFYRGTLRSVPDELRLAIVAILLETCERDGARGPMENMVLNEILDGHFKVCENEFEHVIKAALELRQDGVIDSFARQINDFYSASERELILALNWKLVIADGEIGDSENKFMTQLRYRLMLSEEQARVAKELAIRDKL